MTDEKDLFKQEDGESYGHREAVHNKAGIITTVFKSHALKLAACEGTFLSGSCFREQ